VGLLQPGYDDNGERCAELLRLGGYERAPLRIKIDMRVLLGVDEGRRLDQRVLNRSYRFLKIEINNNSKGSFEIRVQRTNRV
jgi:hypothetical protein